MTPRDDFALVMTAWMEASAPTREPEHLLAATLERTARTRRRPSWLLAERWLPMQLTLRRVDVPRGATLLVVLALIVALAAAALVAIGSRHRLPPPIGVAANGLVAFVDGGLRGGELYVQGADGTGRRQLTSGSSDSYPTWSRDGTKLAFYRLVHRPGPLSIWVINADGSGLRSVTGAMEVGRPDDPSLVSWAPDGASLIFSSAFANAGPAIFAVRVDGTNLDQVVGPELWPLSPVWSPDGTTIAFKGGKSDADRGLYVMNADGTGARRLTRQPAADTYSFTLPQWSPDGRQLLYYAEAGGGSHDIWIVNADGSGERDLTPTLPPVDEYWPAWSPDGTRIAYGVSSNGLFTSDVVVMDADGGQAQMLSRQGVSPQTMPISWSPDGTRILTSACPQLCPADGSSTFVMALDPSGLAAPQQIASIPGLGWVLSWQRVAP
jgi:Tol biopolymer transport system component